MQPAILDPAAKTPRGSLARTKSAELDARDEQSPMGVIARWRHEGALERIATGWPSFDDASRGGFVFARVGFILGAPNAGKTGLAAALAWRWVQEGVACAALCVDETPDDFLTRFAVMSGIDLDAAEARSTSTLAALELRLGRLPLRLFGAEHTIESAAQDFARWTRANNHRRAVLFVDSVQTASSATCTDAHSQRARVGSNVAALSKAAAQHRFAVIATGEIPRSHYSDRGDDLRAGKENGAIEFAAKAQLVLRRSKSDDSVIRVSVPKLKRGKADTHSFALRFDRARHALTEISSEPAEGVKAASAQRARILEVVADTSQSLTSKSDVINAARVKRQAGFALLQGMVDAGEVTVIDGIFRAGKRGAQ